ncbi:hypothetical protein JX265_008868 [Neoarthrinium moseri]|uniref:Nucleoporin Pom152 n=1 Tax=Neoarthrinium moseri TaxID=1658444 RepID=A0A9P9WHN6_9PEZI|nr:uncharacterized protein JN550_009584 [Neoarthrinium moseri]KAI1848352.1 hypothetical protein JX266_005658 [Neoarthrinium moseri]KAI1863473.1 hypothetical protein JN550_009584 [Neoarthrinium moseri]KAI1863651.1 hypothetical protein JX265_008868 [Neoarthrinium moseri]
MNGTPRVRSGGFPQTPGTVAPRARRQSTPTSTPRQHKPARPSLPPAPENRGAAAAADDRPPLIPLTVIDAPSQRFYAVAIYFALFAYRFWDWIGVAEDDAGSFFLFLKWAAIDFTYLFLALPAFRIPWLDLSQPVVLFMYGSQMILNWILMFNIDVPFTAWLLGVVKIFYDRELSISEHNVKVSSILHNSSLIMGKQIINILPEGSALLNPGKTPFCISQAGKSTVTIPIYFNATIPAEVELVRVDLETNSEEVMKLGSSQIREIGKQARKITDDASETSYRYDFPVKKPGAYRLNKVLDEYKLEVQRYTEPTYVVPCPKALVRRAESSTRCLNELSNLSLDVHGTPPLKIVYSRTINGKDHSFHFQSLQPDGFSSPLLGSARSSSIVLADGEDVSWAKAQQVAVSLNESMSQAGEWQYSIDEVHDVFGNVVKYTQSGEEAEVKPKPKHLVQNFVVRERPQATLRGCDLRNPLKVAKGQSTVLPVSFSLPGRVSDRASYTLTWQFSPIDTLTKSGDHGDVVEVGTFAAKNSHSQPTISAPGLYTLKSIACDSCEGEIEEPSSCLLLNPLEPKLSVQAEEIPDKCAGASIGLRVDLDLVGTPPFKVVYDISSDTERSRRESVVVKGLRQQIDLLPRSAGRYQYRFRALEDAIYKNIPLPLGNEYYLEQYVKPPATAFFQDQASVVSACLDEAVEVNVALSGDGPFTLEWELVHDGKKKSEKVTDITSESYKIKTNPLAQGGEYTLALTSIQDKAGCRIFLKEEMKINVRRQRPRAAFGLIENKKAATVVEDAKVSIPLRLSGDGPWKVTYRNRDGGSGEQTKVARSNNDFIETTEHGTFEITDVMDNQCHGQVAPEASTFDIHWFPRPELGLVPADSISERGGVFVKDDVCEGDIDGFEVALKGSSPYHVSYEIKHKPRSGSGSVGRREFDAVMPKASIAMDTAKAGVYTYKFSALADNLYNNDKRKFQPLTLEQTVNAKPSASFAKPGQIFKLCFSEQDYEEKIPITLQGFAPFYVEIEIRHHSGNIPETFRIPNIPTNTYGIQIPRQYLKLGAQTIRIRKVRDARGCQQKIEVGGPSVQVQLYDAPAIYPLETRNDYCVGERIAYTLSGTPPFDVQYTFAGSQMKAKSQTTNFRRIAEAPGEFAITAISDKASDCRAAINLSKTIHPMPSVKISRGKVVRVDIHEGSEVEILFEFWGTPPFEFTYTRSTNAKKGQRPTILETRHDISYEHSKVVTASLEGTYEVVAIKDKFCAFSTVNVEGKERKGGQKMLTY